MKQLKNGVKEQRGGFLSMLLGILGASFLENFLAGKRINRAGERIGRTGYGNKNVQKVNGIFNASSSFK